MTLSMTKEKEARERLIHIQKRSNLPIFKKIGIYGGAILVAFLLITILLIAFNINPISYFSTLLFKPFSNKIYIKNYILKLTPLLLTSLGLLFSFKMKYWNIGAEGQFIMGGISAFCVALLIGNTLPHFLATSLIILAGMAGAMLFGLIPSLLKIMFKTDETILTLMLNYVALYFLTYLFYNCEFTSIMQAFPVFRKLDPNTWLTVFKLNNVNFMDSSIFFAILAFIFTVVYFKYTKQGYEVRVLGDSLNSAKYAGIKVRWVIIRSMLISTAIIGLAASLKLLGLGSSRTLTLEFTNGVGWTAIIICWLAGLNPTGVGITAVLFALLDSGSDIAQITLKVNSAIGDVFQAIILFCVLCCAFLVRYKVTFRLPNKKSKEVTKNA